MAAVGRLYNQAFDRSPTGTLAVTNGLLSAVADIVAQGAQMGLAYRGAQKASPSPPNHGTYPQLPTYDAQRTLRFLIFGTMMGPMLSKWHHFLEVTFPLRPHVSGSGHARSLPSVINGKPITAAGAVGVKGATPIIPGTSSRPGNINISALAKRVGCDQVVMAPIGLVLFLGSMGIMEGHGKEAIKRKYVELFPTAIVSNWKVWPLIQVVNFRFMPLPYRVPFQATCGVFWTLYLSLLNSNRPIIAEETAADPTTAECRS